MFILFSLCSSVLFASLLFGHQKTRHFGLYVLLEFIDGELMPWGNPEKTSTNILLGTGLYFLLVEMGVLFRVPRLDLFDPFEQQHKCRYKTVMDELVFVRNVKPYYRQFVLPELGSYFEVQRVTELISSVAAEENQDRDIHQMLDEYERMVSHAQRRSYSYSFSYDPEHRVARYFRIFDHSDSDSDSGTDGVDNDQDDNYFRSEYVFIGEDLQDPD